MGQWIRIALGALIIAGFIFPEAAHQIFIIGWNDLVTLVTGHSHGSVKIP